MSKEFITIETFGFIASGHHLPFHKGKCFNSHGHLWAYYINAGCFEDELIDGIIFDFGALKQELDHKYLNDIVENPTAENLMLYIRDRLYELNPNTQIKCLRVWEDVKTLINPKDLKNGMGEFISLEKEKL